MTDSRRLPSVFWRQWTATAVSNLGDGIAFVAVPLFALTLTDDERLLAVTASATYLPWILLAFPVGVGVDRFDRRSLLIGANVVRIALFAVIGAGAAGGWMSVWMLFVLLVAVGACEVTFDSTAQAFLPMLVAPDLLARANGLLATAEVIAGSLAGLALGALLFGASSGLPFAVDAVSFGVAAALIATITVPRDGRSGVRSDAVRLTEGIRWLGRHRLVRTVAAMFTVTNFGLLFGQGVFVKYARDELGLDAVGYGALLVITAIGAAAGGFIGERVVARFGERVAVLAPFSVFGTGNVVIGLAPDVWVVAVAGFVLGAAVTVWNVATVTIRQTLIPADLFGRVNSVYRWAGAAAGALAVAGGGLVAHSTGLRVPFIVGGAITIGAAAVFARPLLRELSA